MNVTPLQKSRWPWVAAAGAVLAIAMLGVLYGRNDQAPTPEAADRPANASSSTGSTTPPSAAPMPAAPTMGADASTDEPGAVDPQEAAALRQREQYWQSLVAQYSNEQSDPKWSAKHEYDLTAIALSDLIDRSSVTPEDLSIDCKANVCRIVADFSNSTTASDWATLFTASVGDNMAAGSVRQVSGPTGNPRIEIYGRGR